MKKIVFLLLFLCCQCHGQSLDTLDFWSEYKLVTDTSLSDYLNCTKVDTSIRWHACNNFHGTNIILHYYPYDREFCDSLLHIELDSDSQSTIFTYKQQLSSQIEQEIRIFQDDEWKPTYFYSPEILFEVHVGKKAYFFNSIISNWAIDRRDIDKEIRVKERLRGAYNLYGNPNITINRYSKNGKLINDFDKNFILTEGHIYNNNVNDISRIQVTINNECNDRLIMNFIIIEN